MRSSLVSAGLPGPVHVSTNEAHGLKDKHQAKFNSMAQLPAAIEKAMILAGITVHSSRLEAKIRKASRRSWEN